MEQPSWEQLAEPLRDHGILVRHTAGPLLWYRDGGAVARRGTLWFLFGRDAGTGHLTCWVAARDDASPEATVCSLANLLVTLGRPAESLARQTTLAAHAEIIVTCFDPADTSLGHWKETVDFERAIGPAIERRFASE